MCVSEKSLIINGWWWKTPEQINNNIKCSKLLLHLLPHYYIDIFLLFSIFFKWLRCIAFSFDAMTVENFNGLSKWCVYVCTVYISLLPVFECIVFALWIACFTWLLWFLVCPFRQLGLVPSHTNLWLKLANDYRVRHTSIFLFICLFILLFRMLMMVNR